MTENYISKLLCMTIEIIGKIGPSGHSGQIDGRAMRKFEKSLERSLKLGRNDVVKNGIQGRVGIKSHSAHSDYVVILNHAQTQQLSLACRGHPQTKDPIGQQAHKYEQHHHYEQNDDLLVAPLSCAQLLLVAVVLGRDHQTLRVLGVRHRLLATSILDYQHYIAIEDKQRKTWQQIEHKKRRVQVGQLPLLASAHHTNVDIGGQMAMIGLSERGGQHYWYGGESADHPNEHDH
ncbi:hypothetical protein BpHYR1_005314 [Brachionus plicatilis]|uniref:Uncharacterized protein n=1 Tax=Brachionus plicatilis TaxID=10195 RepID=A0A3M7QBM5_BRAPC|nr:hypothetical protein BpHYR1_005314 [Brachionus plicatilis]